GVRGTVVEAGAAVGGGHPLGLQVQVGLLRPTGVAGVDLDVRVVGLAVLGRAVVVDPRDEVDTGHRALALENCHDLSPSLNPPVLDRSAMITDVSSEQVLWCPCRTALYTNTVLGQCASHSSHLSTRAVDPVTPTRVRP